MDSTLTATTLLDFHRKVLLARGRRNLFQKCHPTRTELLTYSNLINVNHPFDLLFSVMAMSSLSDIDGFLVSTGFDWKDTGTQPVSCHIPQPPMLLIPDQKNLHLNAQKT